jgi:parallel beta-helix repeat protein
MSTRLSTATGTLLLLLNIASAEAAPNGPRCGATVTGTVRLAADLVCASGHGLILRGGATLDCAGHRILGGRQPGQYGVYVRDGDGALVRSCVVEGFEVGFRLRGANAASVRHSIARSNLRYGIEATQDSSGAVIEDNQILANGDEGIHLSGPVARDANHRIVDNTIRGNGAEGIYLLGSHANLIARNTIGDHGAAGIYVKASARNIIDGNTLVNDPVHLVQGSEGNLLLATIVVGHQIRLKEASDNQLYNVSVRASGGRPGIAFDFINSSRNWIVDSEAVNPSDSDIRATASSTDNVFTGLAVSGALECLVDETSSVRVTNPGGIPLSCGP